MEKSLLTADNMLKAEVGTGIDGLRAVLGTAVDWQSDDDNVSLATPSDLIEEACEWSGLPPDEIEAALHLLTLRSRDIEGEGLRYWEQETRQHRLLARPLVLDGESLVIMPWVVRSAQLIHAGYLDDGRLPWPSRTLSPAVRDAFNEYRKKANQRLELEAFTVAAGLELQARRNVRPEMAAAAGLGIPGEIDLLAADSAQKRLWVCEVKDQTPGASSTTIRRRINRFHGNDGHIASLLSKAEAVRSNSDKAAHLAGVDEPTAEWRVVPLMVTRRVEPAAFLAGVDVPFVVVADLGAVLANEDDPPAGHYPIGRDLTG